MIANCSKDEHGKYSGGQAGDQTGKEWAVVKWYNRPWSVVLRYPNRDVARDIEYIARQAAQNDMCGYSQSDRLSFYNRLKNISSWNPANIDTACNADCSSSTSAILIAVGNRLGMRKLKDLSPTLTTKNMKKSLVAAGFTAHVDGIYTGSERYLLPGDILLLENHHVTINLDKGAGNSDLYQVATEVRQGKWGNGSSRKNALTDAGWNYAEVQAEVNLLCWG